MLDDVEGGFTRYAPDRRDACRSTTRPWATRPTARRWWSSPARNMAPAARATGRPRAPCCSACARSSPRASSASTAPTWSAWACCRCSSRTARTPTSLGLDGSETFTHPRRRRDRAAPGRRSRGRPAADGSRARPSSARCRIDTFNELEYFHAGGILHYVLRRLAALSRAGRGLSLRAGDDPASAQARLRQSLQLQPVHRDRLPGHLLRFGRARDRRRVRPLCPQRHQADLSARCMRCTTCGIADPLGAADRRRRMSGWGSMRGWSTRRLLDGVEVRAVDGRSWDE